MAGRTYSVQFLINGALNGQFAAAMAAAQNAMRNLGQAARQVNSALAGSTGTLNGYLSKLQAIAAQSSKYAQLQSSIPKLKTDLSAQIAETNRLAAAYRQQKATVDSYRASMQTLQNQSKSLKSAYESEKATLASLRSQLKTLGNVYNTTATAQGKNSAAALALKSQLEALKASIATQSSTVQSAKSAYDTMRSAVKSAAQELKAAEASLRTLGTSFDSSKAKVKGLYDQLKSQKSQLESLKSSLSSAGFSTDHFIQSEMKLRSEIEATTRAIERQAQVAARLTSAQGNLNTASSNLGDAQSAFNTVTNAVRDVASPFVEATKTAMTFEHAMSRVKALTQSQLIREGQTELVAQNMEKLEKQALDLGATTQFTAVEAAQAMGFLGMAGWKTEQIYGTMPGMLDLAAAAGADLAQTADIVSDNMTAMGVPVEQAGHFMDVYAYALTNSNARLTDFGETMKYAAPVAKAYGSTLDETAAMVMMMANAGIKGSMAGTSLRMGLLRLAGPPKTATKEMQKLGLSLSDAQAGAEEAQAVINALGIDLGGATTASDKMTRVLMQLHDKTKNLSQDEKLAAFKGIFGVNAETGWLALFDQGPEIFMKYVNGLRQADGYSKQVASTMMDDTQGAMTFLQSAIEAASVSVGRALTPAVRTAAETITPLIGRFAQWAEQNPRIIQGIVGIGAALAGVAVLVTGVALAFATWSFITAQIGMFTAGMAAVRAGMVATEIASLGMTARMGAAFATLRAGLAGLTLSSAAAGISSTFAAIGAGIRAATMAAWGFIATPLGAALLALAIAAYAVYTNWDKIAPAISSVGDAMSESLSGASQAIDNLMNALGPIGEKISEAFSGLSNIDIGFLDTIAKAFIVVVNVMAGQAISMVNIFTAAVNTIADLFGGLGDVMSEAMEGNFLKAGLRAKQMVADIKKDWENINFSKMDFGYDISGNISAQIAAYNQAAHPTPGQIVTQGAAKNNYASVFGGMQSVVTGQPPPQPAPAPVQQATAQPTMQQPPPIDTTQFKAGLDAAGQSALQFPQALDPAAQSLLTLPQNLQPTQQALQNFPQTLQPVQEALTQFPESLTPVKESFSNFGQSLEPVNAAVTSLTASITALSAELTANTTSLTANTAGITAATSALTAFSAALQATLGALAAFTAALMTTIGGLTALASSSSSAASSVSSLGSAASAAASALSAAATSIASAAASAASAAASASAAAASAGGGAKANYKGGIYNKGAFLTWFAEKSPEAAIPLDKSRRAIGLWTQAGQMLGVLPSENGVNLPTEKPQSDSTKRGINNLQREKVKRAQQVYNSVVNQITAQSMSSTSLQKSTLENVTFEKMASTIRSVSNVQKSVQNLQAAQFDELGNIIGLNGAAGNVITKYDNDKIKHVKQSAQIKEYEQKQTQIEKATREVAKTSETIKATKSESFVSRIQEKFSSAIESAKKYLGISEKREYTEMDGVKVYERREPTITPTVLTEQQRYRTEKPYEEKTLERIKNSRSYQAISKVMNADNRKSTSILNKGELNTKIITDATGGLFSKIFGSDFGLGQIATQGGFKIEMPDIMHPTPTVPNQATSNLPPIMTSTVFNPDVTKSGGGELNTRISTDITGGLFSKIFGTDFGLGQIATQGGLKIEMPNIMRPTPTFPNALMERENVSERLENVATNTSNDYSAAAFQPTFNITVTVNGSGENIDTKAIGESIAYSARESFEKEFLKFEHERQRRGYV